MNRQDLKGMLARHRALIDPVDYGFPAPTMPRRGPKVHGLSQHQLDLLLSQQPYFITTGTLGRLVGGKLPRPESRLLDAIAELLRLTEDERVMLFLLATGAKPPHPLDPSAPVRLRPSWQLALDGIEHMAYITDVSWRLLAYNRHFPALFPQGRPPKNIMWWMVLCPEARELYFPYWKDLWGPLALAQLKAAVVANPQSGELAGLEQQVLADPVTGPMYADPQLEYIHPDTDTRPLVHAELGPGMATICAAEPFSMPGARLMIILFRPGEVVPPPGGSTDRRRSARR
ncbi:XRE family transcriptional regulator [Streptacidiphilus sp. EB129]|uniref:MmyB family transcriptional regulator n=1 Tax=Streptacidiphilus sp. EB129 TaxID=3156262 RepID=UPI0035153A5C